MRDTFIGDKDCWVSMKYEHFSFGDRYIVTDSSDVSVVFHNLIDADIYLAQRFLTLRCPEWLSVVRSFNHASSYEEDKNVSTNKGSTEKLQTGLESSLQPTEPSGKSYPPRESCTH